jgi:hypothetical protein
LTAYNSIGVVVVYLKHDEPLNVDIALCYAFHEVVVAEVDSFEGRLKESDDAVADVFAELPANVLHK